MHLLRFKYVSAFGKSRANFTLFTPVKIMGEAGKIYESDFKLSLKPGLILLVRDRCAGYEIQ